MAGDRLVRSNRSLDGEKFVQIEKIITARKILLEGGGSNYVDYVKYFW